MKRLFIIFPILLLAGCAGVKHNLQNTAGCSPCPSCPICPAVKPPEPVAVIPVAPQALPDFADLDAKEPLLKAAELNLKYFKTLQTEPPVYTFGTRKITSKELSASTQEIIKTVTEAATPADLDRKIKERFDIFQLAGRDSTGTVVFSSYYEPTLEASLKRTKLYKYPAYAKPKDLITVNLENFNDKFKGEKLSGRIINNEFVPYRDREAIDFDKALKSQKLEIAWFKNRADLMDLHIEGSGRLKLTDGRTIMAKFAATNSLKFKGWLTALIESGAMPREGISHEKGKQYLLDHPEKERAIMSANKRYTFFKLEEPADPGVGPDGTYGLPLVGWRSIAIDNALIPMGALAFMAVNTPDVDGKGTLLGRKDDSRFVFCQDTGGAIKGPGRVDFFVGNGDKARTFAFKLWDQGRLYILVKKENAPSK